MKRILSLILILSMVAALLASCNSGGGGGTSTESSTSESSTESLFHPDRESEKGEEPEQELSGFAAIPDGDVLAHSLNRIKNADLSFNMSISAKTVTADNFSVKDLHRLATAYSEGDTSEIYTYLPEDQPNYMETDFFEAQQDTLERTRNTANSMRDFFLGNITVMNKVVTDGYWEWMLSYDEETGDLTIWQCLLANPDTGDGGPEAGDYAPKPFRYSQATRVIFSYDDEGTETISWLNYEIGNTYDGSDGWNFYSLEIIYTPEKYYSIKKYPCNLNSDMTRKENTGTLEMTVATRESGRWEGISANFHDDRLTGDTAGDYNRGESVLGISFLVDTEYGAMDLSAVVYAYLDGECYNDLTETPADELRLEIGQMFSPYVITGSGALGFDFYIQFSLVDGWEKVSLEKTEEDRYEIGLRDDNDYVLLENGNVLYGNLGEGNDCYWSPKVGQFYAIFESLTWTTTYVTRADGVVHDEAWFKSEVGDWYAIIEGQAGADPFTPNKLTPFVLTFRVPAAGAANKGLQGTTVNAFEMLRLFFKDMGLTMDDIDSDAYISAMEYETKSLTEVIYRFMSGEEGEGITAVRFARSEIATAKALPLIFNTLSTYETVDIDDIPDMPNEIPALSLSGKVTGVPTLGAEESSFIGVTVEVDRSVLLSPNKSYTAEIVFRSEGYVATMDGLFTEVRYSGASFTMEGMMSTPPFPILPAGEYDVGVVVITVLGDGFSAVSEEYVFTEFHFTEFTREEAGNGGRYVYTYAKNSTKLTVSEEFIDETAPAYTVMDATVDGEGRHCLNFEYGATVTSLLSKLDVIDNYDGRIYPSWESVTVTLPQPEELPEGEPTPVSDSTVSGDASGEVLSEPFGPYTLLVNGALYTVEICDCAGNSVSLDILVTVVGEPLPEEGGEAPAV